MLNDGLAQHWAPFWQWCRPCAPGQEPHYVFELAHAEEDKNHALGQLGYNTSIPYRNDNPTRE